MMVMRIMPLIVIGFIALLLLVAVLFYLRWRRESRVEEEVRAYQAADSPCYAQNGMTGWVCDRWDHHPGNHRQTINGETFDWPRDEGGD